MTKAAQEVLDRWIQDEEGIDEELGAGGACDRISQALAEVIMNAVPDVEIADGGQDGDDHAFLIAYDAKEAFGIDIPPGVYETGGGYSWKKTEGAKVSPEDIVIWKVDRDLIAEW